MTKLNENYPDNKIKYRDLSVTLKIAVICALVSGGLFLLSFIIGFFEGLLGF